MRAFITRVPIAAENVETARWLEAHNAGVVLAEPLAQSLPRFCRTKRRGYADLRAAAAALDTRLLAFTREDCRTLLAEP